MWDPYAEFKSQTLPNGLTVHVATWPGRPWEALGFLVHSGAAQDSAGLEGIAHFVEHLASNNTFKSNKDIRAFFADCGGGVELGATDYFSTKYCFFAPAKKIIMRKALAVFGQMLFLSELKKSVEHERQVIIGEFNREYPTQMQYDLALERRQILYGGHWLERMVSPLGSIESIQRITQDDLQAFYDAHYTPANTSIIAVGGLTISAIIDLIMDSPFAAEKDGQRTPLLKPADYVSPPSETRRVIEASKYFSLQKPLELCSYCTIVKIPGKFNVRVIQIVIKMLEDVLFNELRDKRAWTYHVSCRRHDFQEFYSLLIDSGPLALNCLDAIEEVINRTIKSINKRVDLFKKQKHRYLVGCLMLDESGTRVRNCALGDLAYHHRIISLKELCSKTKEITIDDIRDILNWLRPEQRFVVITKP